VQTCGDSSHFTRNLSVSEARAKGNMRKTRIPRSAQARTVRRLFDLSCTPSGQPRRALRPAVPPRAFARSVMVVVRPLGWGQTAIGEAGPGNGCTWSPHTLLLWLGREERWVREADCAVGKHPTGSTGNVNIAPKRGPPPAPKIHIRIPLSEEGDCFEDLVDWDLTDPKLQAPEVYGSPPVPPLLRTVSE
jgi:hypothetical protein